MNRGPSVKRLRNGNGILVSIHVVPNAKETKILREPDGSLTMRVQSPPLKGRANREIVKWLSKKLDTPGSQVRIVAGVTSNLKILEILGMDEGIFLEHIQH